MQHTICIDNSELNHLMTDAVSQRIHLSYQLLVKINFSHKWGGR